MAYTPYPLGLIETENPCIAVSHDGLNWETPLGLENPISNQPSNGYNSDTHLVYDAKKDRLELWWRPYDFDLHDSVCRSVSDNGISWSTPETVIDYKEISGLVLSPAVWIKDNKYHLIYSNGSKLKYINVDYDSKEWNWSEPVTLPIALNDLRAWHQDVIFDDEGNLEVVFCGYEPGGNNNTADLYYVKLDKDFNASTVILILKRGTNEADFDFRSIYRASILKINGKYFIYYSAIDIKWHRSMSLTIGDSIDHLRGITKKTFVNAY